MGQLTKKQRSFFFCIYGLAILVVFYCLVLGKIQTYIVDIRQILFFILVIGLSESVTLYFRKMSFSTTFAITLATYIILGPFESLICLLGGFLIRVLKIDENTYKHLFNTPLYGTAFNCSMLTIVFLVSHVIVITLKVSLELQNQIIQVCIFSICYFILNKVLVSILQSVYTGNSVMKSLTNEFILSLISYAIMVPFGIMFAILYEHYSYWGIIMPLFPVLLVKYTFTYYAEAKMQYTQTVETLMNAIEARDYYTQGHSKRVGEIAGFMAKELGYSHNHMEKLRVAAMLHDVGKIGISDNILRKSTKLSDEEFRIIKSHPEIGEGIIQTVSYLQYTRPIIRNHHERYDGKGYPDGKKGDELSQDVYIIQLADAIDAMASDRPYRKGLPQDIIIEEIKKGRGTQFHPKVVDVYLNLIASKPEIIKIWE